MHVRGAFRTCLPCFGKPVHFYLSPAVGFVEETGKGALPARKNGGELLQYSRVRPVIIFVFLCVLCVCFFFVVARACEVVYDKPIPFLDVIVDVPLTTDLLLMAYRPRSSFLFTLEVP